MAKKDIPTSEAHTHADAVDALREIGEQLKGIGQVLEEIRTDFQWAAQNCRIDPEEAKRSKPVASDDVQPPRLLATFDEGDAVILNHDGVELFGEVVSINDAENLAKVLLIPSNETITVIQDQLSRIQPDGLRRLCTDETSRTPSDRSPNAGVPDARHAAPGQLF